MKIRFSKKLVVVFVMLGLLVVAGLLLRRSIIVSQMEITAPASASYSIAASQESGAFVCRARVNEGMLEMSGKKVAIADAWLERVVDVKFHLLFFRERTYRNEYLLVLKPDVLTDSASNFIVADSSFHYMATQSAGVGKQLVLVYALDTLVPEFMKLFVFDARSAPGSMPIDTLLVEISPTARMRAVREGAGREGR